MMQYNFDEQTHRRGTDSYKWDSAKDNDILPLWVADMDFRTAPAVIEALQRRVDGGIFGYVKVPDSYYESLSSWFRRRHGWTIDKSKVIYTSGVVPAVSAIIKALTKPGDGVIVQIPAYNCFFSSIRNNGCNIVVNKLLRRDTSDGFTYSIDFEELEKLASETRNKLMLLCNPHNPTGRIWTRAELEHVRDICHRHGVRVVSDEIHCELTMPGHEYVPYAIVDKDAIICCSPSKAFNIAGLQIANIVCPDEEIMNKTDRAINDNEVCDVNPFGVDALQAAYDHGVEWLDALRTYLKGNYGLLRTFFASNMPAATVANTEATYLAWIDIRSTGMSSVQLEKHLLNAGRVWVNAGSMYGDDNYIRINFACQRERLIDGLNRIRSAWPQG